jgi:hypothetical protein
MNRAITDTNYYPRQLLRLDDDPMTIWDVPRCSGREARDAGAPGPFRRGRPPKRPTLPAGVEISELLALFFVEE